MKNFINIVGIGSGIFIIFIGLIYSGDFISSQGITWSDRVDSRIFILGLILVLYNLARLLGLFSFMNKNHKDEACKFNFREINYGNNCSKCKYYNIKSVEADNFACKIFNIETDENHMCDLFCMQINSKN
jgi:hypothetical protein